ncbi:MAG: HAD-IC family P-type ATPase [Bacillota bacterium]
MAESNIQLNEDSALDEIRTTVDFSVGLTSEEVQERVSKGQVNGDQNIKTKSVGQIIKTHTLTFFNMIMMISAVLVVIFTPKNGIIEVADFANLGFLGVAAFNIAVGLIQEVKAKKTIDKLTLLSAPKVAVKRDGKVQNIAIEDIVKDDIMVLTAGQQITSDCVIVDGFLEVNESQITGEPDAISKEVGVIALSGSYVVSGNATTQVIHIGKDNFATKISSGAKYIKETNSEILKSLNMVIKIMSTMVFPLGILLVAVKGFAQSNDISETVLTVLGSITGMIPSGLMALTSAVFCVSIVRLARHKTLAQDLYCAESLARVDVLCLDKTGTITEGRMEVVSIVDKAGLKEEEIADILAMTTRAVGDRNPTAEAILDYTVDCNSRASASSIIAFNAKRKWSSATFSNKTYVIGATEFILPITEEIEMELNSYGEKGQRVIALVECNGTVQGFNLPEEKKLLAFVIITDKIRAEAPATLAYFAEQGVTIKIISGDNPVTVKSIAERAGVNDSEKYVDASTLVTDDMIAEAVQKYTIFGRVTPDQKLKLVQALKKQGHKVGMTGDGVNDVLALKESDCSIAMASGSDASKSVSQLVLLDSNFGSMPKIVAEGRRSINNLQRTAALYLMKTLYNFMLALAFLVISSDLPFMPKHLTLIGTACIGIPSYVLALEPNNERVQGKFFSTVISNALPGAIAVTFGVAAITLASRAVPSLDSNQISTICLIYTCLVSIVFVTSISIPLNGIRTALIFVMIAMIAGSFVIDIGSISLADMFGLSRDFTWDMMKILIPTIACTIPIFIACLYFVRLLNKRNITDKVLEKLKIT